MNHITPWMIALALVWSLVVGAGLGIAIGDPTSPFHGKVSCYPESYLDAAIKYGRAQVIREMEMRSDPELYTARTPGEKFVREAYAHSARMMKRNTAWPAYDWMSEVQR